MDVVPTAAATWEGFLNTSIHPWSPTTAEILATTFSPDERQLYEKTLRPLIEAREQIDVETIAYVTATKPIADRRFY